MKKRILIPVMSMGFLVFGAFYSPDQNTVSVQVNTEKSSVSESEFWLGNGNPTRYSPYYNTILGSADLSSSTKGKKAM